MVRTRAVTSTRMLQAVLDSQGFQGSTESWTVAAPKDQILLEDSEKHYLTIEDLSIITGEDLVVE